MCPHTVRESGDDRCPGAVRLHSAGDGSVARIRVPGGRLTVSQLAALADLADGLGDGRLHLTSRGNVQVRGLSEDAGPAVARVLQAIGLLPSPAHDRVRNVVASPHGGALVDEAVAAVDAALVADPGLVRLSGRFLFGVDDGSGDVLALEPDLCVLPLPAEVATLVPRGGRDCPPRWQLIVDGAATGEYGDPAGLLTGAAHRFLAVREAHEPNAWRVRDLGPYVDRVAAPRPDETCHLGGQSLPPRGARVATSAVEAWIPLGTATAAQWRDVAEAASAWGAGRVVLTPWRSVVVPDPVDVDKLRIALQDTGFSLDGMSGTALTTACIGRPGCASARADVRGDAVALAADNPGRRLHVSGCERRCGHPAGPHLEAVAGSSGYQIQER